MIPQNLLSDLRKKYWHFPVNLLMQIMKMSCNIEYSYECDCHFYWYSTKKTFKQMVYCYSRRQNLSNDTKYERFWNNGSIRSHGRCGSHMSSGKCTGPLGYGRWPGSWRLHSYSGIIIGTCITSTTCSIKTYINRKQNIILLIWSTFFLIWFNQQRNKLFNPPPPQ